MGDKCLLKSDLIVLTETWLEQGENVNNDYDLTNYEANFNNVGRGRGIASYFNNKFKHTQNVNFGGFSISKVESDKLDIIGIYRSQEGNVQHLIEQLEALIKETKTTVIGGDINICALSHPQNYVTESLKAMGFKQIVTRSTHI